MADALRIADRPLQCLHAAQAAADNRRPLLDAEYVGQSRLAVYPVLDGQYREAGAIALAGRRVDAGGAGRAVAATQVVQADHKKAVGIDRLAGADAVIPPAGLAFIDAVIAGGVVVPGQGVTDQYRVAGAGVQFTVGLVDQFVTRQLLATGQ